MELLYRKTVVTRPEQQPELNLKIEESMQDFKIFQNVATRRFLFQRNSAEWIAVSLVIRGWVITGLEIETARVS